MLTVICPTRGRPGAALEANQSFLDTIGSRRTKLVFVVDSDDPTRDDYIATHLDVVFLHPPPGSMNAALNEAAGMRAITRVSTVLGFIGDDHRFRTQGWDEAIDDYLTEHTGIAYADDLFQRERLPTNWFVSMPIVKEFGMGLPSLKHLYIDDYWKALGTAAGCLYYLPDIVIEHMHPAANKGEWDEGYKRVNSEEMYSGDLKTFTDWRNNQMASDVERLKEIVG